MFTGTSRRCRRVCRMQGSNWRRWIWGGARWRWRMRRWRRWPSASAKRSGTVSAAIGRSGWMATDATTANDVLVIRPFIPADQAAARALVQAGMGEHFGAIDETRNSDLDDIQAHYS